MEFVLCGRGYQPHGWNQKVKDLSAWQTFIFGSSFIYVKCSDLRKRALYKDAMSDNRYWAPSVNSFHSQACRKDECTSIMCYQTMDPLCVVFYVGKVRPQFAWSQDSFSLPRKNENESSEEARCTNKRGIPSLRFALSIIFPRSCNGLATGLEAKLVYSATFGLRSGHKSEFNHLCRRLAVSRGV